MANPYGAIIQKLKRADEGIGNLNREINDFFLESNYPAIPNEDNEAFTQAMEYHARRLIPARFSILIDEILYHLRSSLDYLVWGHSSPDAIKANRDIIEFPILTWRPRNEGKQARFDRKIEGLSPALQAVVKGFQPYEGTPAGQNLAILHEFHRSSKHRELLLVAQRLTFPLDFSRLHITPENNAEFVAAFRGFVSAVQVDSGTAFQIVFPKFGNREGYPVVLGLRGLTETVMQVVIRFTECKS